MHITLIPRFLYSNYTAKCHESYIKYSQKFNFNWYSMLHARIYPSENFKLKTKI